MKRISDSLHLGFRVLKLQATPLLLLMLVQIANGYLAEQMQNHFHEQGRDNPLEIAWILLFSIVSDMLLGAAFCVIIVPTANFLISTRTSEDSPTTTRLLGEHLSAVLVEGVRVSSRIIFALPFFIVPAIYQYLKFTLVQYVVLLNPDYKNGSVDALHESGRLLGKSLHRSALVIVVGIFTPGLLSLVFEFGSDGLLAKPLALISSGVLHLGLTLVSNCYLYFFFKEVQDAHIQLA